MAADTVRTFMYIFRRVQMPRRTTLSHKRTRGNTVRSRAVRKLIDDPENG